MTAFGEDFSVSLALHVGRLTPFFVKESLHSAQKGRASSEAIQPHSTDRGTGIRVSPKPNKTRGLSDSSAQPDQGIKSGRAFAEKAFEWKCSVRTTLL
jgi:hypothetical protein